MTFRKFLVSISFLFFALYVQGQIVDNNQTKQDSTNYIKKEVLTEKEHTKAERDSIIKAKLSVSSTQDFNKKDDTTTISKKHHSPTKATLYSIVPGLGQIYNKQAWKVPVIYVAEGAVMYFAVTNYKGAQKFKKEYSLRANGIEDGRNPNYVNFPDQSIYNLYYAYQKNFELSIMAGVLVYVFNIVDAMVYGHLFDYDISPNLSLNLTPYCLPSITSNPTFGLSMKFNVK